MARHIQERQTPLPLEVSMKVRMRTGNESLVNMLAVRGLSISHDHLRRLSTDLINSVITLWEQIVEVVPAQVIREKFATRVIDNIDYNPSSTTPDSVLHGTSISKLHNFTYYQDNTPKPNIFGKKMGENTAKHLPASLNPPHGDGRRRNQLHLPSNVYITSHPMSHKMPVRSQCGCTGDCNLVTQ